MNNSSLKAAKYEIQKTLNLSRNIVSLQVFVHVSRFSPYAINLARNKNIGCGLKKSVAKSRALVYFEQQILALLLVFHQTHNLSRNKCRHIRSTPSKSTNQRAAFLQPATNVFVAEKVDRARWKTGNIDVNLHRDNVARQVEGFCILYFAAFSYLEANGYYKMFGDIWVLEAEVTFW